MRKQQLFIILLLICCSLIASVAISYRDTPDNDFLETWDVDCYITENPHIRELNRANGWWMLKRFHCGNWHPLTWFSHALDYALFGDKPKGHHLVSIVWHGLNVLLFFLLTFLVLNLHRSKGHVLFAPDNKTLFSAGAAALLFAVHPLHVESVAWLAERKSLLCQFFSLLTLIAYFIYAKKPETALRWYAGALFFFVLALLAKPMAVTIPALLLLLDVYPLRRSARTLAGKPAISRIQLAAEKIPFFVLSGAVIILTLLAQKSGAAIADTGQIGLQVRFINAFNSLLQYITQTLFPANLSPYYPYTPLRSFHEHYPSLIPPAVFLLISLLCAYAWHKKHDYWAAAWLFYLISVSPVIGIIQVGGQGAADRYTYFTTLPFYVLCAAGLAGLYDKSGTYPWKKIGRAALFAGVLSATALLSYLSTRQNRVWANNLNFWNYLVLQSPAYSPARVTLARVYFNAGLHEQALHHAYQAATQDPRVYYDIIMAYLQLKRYSEALQLCLKVLADNIDTGQGKNRLYYLAAWIYRQQGETAQAREMLDQALRGNPDNKPALELRDALDNSVK